MTRHLDPARRRVLGVLVEKAFTTPGSYPLTLSALVAGCNQLTCREPVLKLTEDEVARAARELGAARLVEEVSGARVERYRHRVEEEWGWTGPRLALVAELLLRGPQTAGELKTNASRMVQLPELEGVVALLKEFAARTPPVVRELPRQPGKSAVRFDHLWYGPDEAAPPAAAEAPGLEARVAALEAEVAALREELRRRQ